MSIVRDDLACIENAYASYNIATWVDSGDKQDMNHEWRYPDLRKENSDSTGEGGS